MYIYGAIFIYRIRIRKPDSQWKQNFAGHPTALGKYPFTVTKLQGHSTTECCQMHHKCLTWFCLCFRGLFGQCGVPQKLFICSDVSGELQCRESFRWLKRTSIAHASFYHVARFYKSSHVLCISYPSFFKELFGRIKLYDSLTFIEGSY